MEEQVQNPSPKSKRFRNKKTILIAMLLIIVLIVFSIGLFIFMRNMFFSGDRATNNDQADEQRFVVVDGDSIHDITSVVEQYSIFNEAMQESGLLGELRKDAEYTMFVPTNETFEAYFKENGTSKDKFIKNSDTKNILSYHILPTKILAQELADMDTIKTLQGQQVAIGQDDEANLTVNGVKITEIDIDGEDGVIHVVEKVLSPK